MTALLAPTVFNPPRHFTNGAEWLHALGDVPLERIVFDPWPGTATEADLLKFVERDKRLCELIDGTLVEKPVGCWEGLIAARLITQLTNFADARNLGAVFGADSTMRMNSGRVRLPDVGFVSLARLPKTLAPIPSLAPDLAVEVLSEGNAPQEMAQKLVEYFASGTRLAWFIQPKTRTVAVYHSPGLPTRIIDEQGHLEGEDVLPGFTLAVSELFRNVPSNK